MTGVINLTTDVLFFNAFSGADITEVHGPDVTGYLSLNTGGTVRGNTFTSCAYLEVADFPKLTKLASGLFFRCIALETLNLPLVDGLDTTTTGNVFAQCTSLEYLVLPSYADLTYNGFANSCSKLKAVDLKAPTSIGASSFNNDTVLDMLVFRGTTACALGNINAFNNTPFASGKAGGTLYVPQSTIASYQSASNWSTILGYANNQIKSIESTHTDPNAPIDLTLYYADGTLIPT